MAQVDRKENLSVNASNHKSVLTEFLEQIDEKNITIISCDSDQFIYKDDQNRIHKIIKIGDKFIKATNISPNIIQPNFSDNHQKPNLPKKNRKIKTKRGRVSSLNAAKILIPAAIISLGTIIGVAKYVSTPANEIEVLEITPEDIPEEIEELDVNEITKVVMRNNIAKKEVDQSLIQDEIVISQTTNVVVSPKEDLSKREETDRLYGSYITKYTTRYGIATSLGSALITQERPNNSNENIGQLTRNICGERIVIPIIDDKNNEGLEKIYVIRDIPDKNNFEEEEAYREALDTYKSQLEEGKKLATKGYQIYKFEDLMTNTEANIHISMAWLTYSIYKCDTNINQGVRGYNGGYNAAKVATDEEIANGKITIGDAFYNEHVFSYLYPDEIEGLECYFKSVPYLSEEEKASMTEEEIIRKQNELAKSASVIKVSINFAQVRILNNEEEATHRI